MKKEKKENILVLVSGEESSLRFMELGYNAAKEEGGAFYVLHVEEGNAMQMDREKMISLQKVAEYGGKLGGTVCFACDEDVNQFIGDFAREKQISRILVEPLPKKRRQGSLLDGFVRLQNCLPPQVRLLTEQEWKESLSIA